MADGPLRGGGVLLCVPATAREGSVLLARVRLVDHASPTVVGDVTLTRTIAYRYRQEEGGGSTHLATARRSEVVARQALPAHGAPAGEPYDVEVLLPVPAEGPASADTGLVCVDWAVRARLDAGGGEVVQAVERVTVQTAASAFDAATAEPARGDARGHTVVTFERLSDRRIAPGVRLTGEVVVVPLHPGPMRSVRLELVLHERVPHGPGTEADPAGGKATSTVVAALDLAHGVDGGEDLRPRRFPFVLDVPRALPAPSIVTEEFVLGWALRAVVRRPLHRDAFAELALQAVTAVP